jgi:cation diffusion facilitator CzcD-associated flavoprotein CzcO
MSYDSCNVAFAVVGAGPYGLAVASHLRAAGAEVRTLGKVMGFWDEHMPRGMLVRSPRGGSHIGDPDRALTLDRYEADQGARRSGLVPREDFVRYGRWFQARAVPDVDPRRVIGIERAEAGFRLTLEDGDGLWARRVVVATGIGAFPNVPPPFAALPAESASHTSDSANRDLSRFSGRRVLVVGGGQSALESAALLHEAGVDVEVLLRQPRVRWLRSRPVLEWLMDCRLNPFKTPGKIGPVGINWLVEHPRLFALFPRGVQDRMARRAIRPAASSWLRPRVERVPIRAGRQVVSAALRGHRVALRLDDGSQSEADHVLLGTGYKVDIARYPFLAPQLVQAVRTVDGYPVLGPGFESSLPGLHFVGAAAAYSYGPLCRFVAGTGFTAAHLTHFVRRKPTPRPVAVAQS